MIDFSGTEPKVADSSAELTPLTQKQIEDTPAFKAWGSLKKEEAKNYVSSAFGLELNLEDLLIWRDDAGWPDPVGRAGSYKMIVANQKYRDSKGNVLGNYNVWRKLPVIETPAIS
ncbi:MAG: hypothetical protein JGK17_28300 [Microcoleus sp. PH2017_10_PVI_O_A]|uniref:hypothetical protein n=1 Tax=unclassified Microcoleus TaxID=2642155 RepID=UPI001DCE1A68|nr:MULTISPECIES: hypothetical protein [unclassified Microcoleus]MCC3409388.1 hypothetical protein [Microcoleus sp. PH2017_10_PVI_O_A]MCC3463631.1 hypothetical protein [Microcoleus sp. PH2017_11_PCY_U_A]MCC3481961.1 hypothetical protein [Microcoleus sp. PH2017_12_PCY_D_A]MCC3532324.1 hypothetical protein [Microcoleus sp. PH2017_21_RUC_O_A]MCC3544623.1 hypothetical protein [Microcoleus sp. PH2017_22_RUC_O_B]